MCLHSTHGRVSCLVSERILSDLLNELGLQLGSAALIVLDRLSSLYKNLNLIHFGIASVLEDPGRYTQAIC